MAQNRSVTPEKQLLNLIEDPKGTNTPARAHAIMHHGLSLFSLSAWKSRLSFLRGRLQKKFQLKDIRSIDVKVLNNLLGACVVIMAVYLAAGVSISLVNMNKAHRLGDEAIGKGEKYESPKETAIIKKAISYYLEKVGQRDIFKMGAKKAVAPAARKEAKAAPSSAIIEATQDLKLVGISWSKDPDAMIEDTKLMRTYFVKRGGSIGDIKVQAMFKNKVILSYGGEEIELR
ncbi:MAG: hypothetical protein V1682_03640 [Candidatus Omnitrophota bacterium]